MPHFIYLLDARNILLSVELWSRELSRAFTAFDGLSHPWIQGTSSPTLILLWPVVTRLKENFTVPKGNQLLESSNRWMMLPSTEPMISLLLWEGAGQAPAHEEFHAGELLAFELYSWFSTTLFPPALKTYFQFRISFLFLTGYSVNVPSRSADASSIARHLAKLSFTTLTNSAHSTWDLILFFQKPMFTKMLYFDIYYTFYCKTFYLPMTNDMMCSKVPFLVLLVSNFSMHF